MSGCRSGSCRAACCVFLRPFFFSSRRRHTRYIGDWSSDVCSSDLRRDRTDPRRRVSTEISREQDEIRFFLYTREGFVDAVAREVRRVYVTCCCDADHACMFHLADRKSVVVGKSVELSGWWKQKVTQ